VTVVARRLASVPRRTSVETWQRLVDLISAEGSPARAELSSITSVASMLIAEEYTTTAPVTISGGGPLVRVYTLHGQDAIEYDLDDEAELAFDPTGGDSWILSLPAAGADIAIAQAAVAAAAHVEVRDLAEAERSTAAQSASPRPDLVLDLQELERP
jgi:hypothetical protein